MKGDDCYNPQWNKMNTCLLYRIMSRHDKALDSFSTTCNNSNTPVTVSLQNVTILHVCKTAFMTLIWTNINTRHTQLILAWGSFESVFLLKHRTSSKSWVSLPEIGRLLSSGLPNSEISAYMEKWTETSPIDLGTEDTLVLFFSVFAQKSRSPWCARISDSQYLENTYF